MGLKCTILLLNESDLEFAKIAPIISNLGKSAGVLRMDAHFHPSIDLSELFFYESEILKASFLAIRTEQNHPGPTALAYHLSNKLGIETLAIESNDFYQSAGFQLWDSQGERTAGAHIDGQIKTTKLGIHYTQIPQQGLELFFKMSLAPKDEKKMSLFLLEELSRLSDSSPGRDHRVLENGQFQDSIINPPGEGIDWNWNTGALEWPMLRYPTTLKINSRKR